MPNEQQEELLLEERKTLLLPVQKEVSWTEEVEHESAFARIRRIMKDGSDE